MLGEFFFVSFFWICLFPYPSWCVIPWFRCIICRNRHWRRSECGGWFKDLHITSVLGFRRCALFLTELRFALFPAESQSLRQRHVEGKHQDILLYFAVDTGALLNSFCQAVRHSDTSGYLLLRPSKPFCIARLVDLSSSVVLRTQHSKALVTSREK